MSAETRAKRPKKYTDATRMVGEGVDPDEPRPHMVCLGCRARHLMALPMNVVMAVATIKAFVKIHRACRAPDATSVRDPDSPSVGAQSPPRDSTAPALSPDAATSHSDVVKLFGAPLP